MADKSRIPTQNPRNPMNGPYVGKGQPSKRNVPLQHRRPAAHRLRAEDVAQAIKFKHMGGPPQRSSPE